MKKYFTAVVTTIVLLSNVHAQKMHEGAEIIFADLKLERSNHVFLIDAFRVNDGYIVFKKEPIRGPGGYHYFIEKFDRRMNSIQIHDVSKQFEDENYVIGSITKVGKTYFLFTTRKYKKQLKEELYVQTFNWKSGALSERNKLYTQLNEKKRNYINYEVRTSPDKSLLLLIIHPIYQKNELEKVHLTVYDDSMQEFWAVKNFKVDYLDKNYSIINTVLGNKATVHMLGRNFIKKDKKAGIKARSEYEVISIFEGDKRVEKLDQGERKFDDISLKITSDGSLILGGYYRIKGGIGIDGVFLFNLTNKGKVKSKTWDAFSTEFITAEYSEKHKMKMNIKEKKGLDLGITNLYLRDVIQHDNGEMSMVGEIYWVTTYTTTNSNGVSTTHTTHHYGDLIISRISTTGEVLRHVRYNKHHTFWGQYRLFDLNNELAILINGNRTLTMDVNLDEMSKKERKIISGTALLLAHVNKEGEEVHKMLLDYKKREYEGFGSYHLQNDIADVSDNEFIMITYCGKKKFGIARLKFDKD
ncbi:MAG: hypothetical protein JKY54_07350 [Flavobacteriales bacterium]|nr:hypothetical protein [Flavobacteriales bacterium]